MEQTLTSPTLLKAPTAIMGSLHELDTALTRLYDEHAAAIYRFCLGMLGRREDAEDTIQGLWLKLARDPSSFFAALDPKAYLWAMARNLVRSRLRRRALEWLWTPALDPDTVEQISAADESRLDPATRRDLFRAVSQLRPRLREVVLLVGIEGHTLEEAAALLDIPRGTAASRFYAATQKLRQSLGTDPATR